MLPRKFWLSITLAVVGAAFLVVADVGTYANRTVFDSGDFADRATRTLDDQAVRAEISTTVTDQVTRGAPDLLAVRPLIEATVQSAVGTGAFRSLLRDATEATHATLFNRDSDSAVLKVLDVGALVSTALSNLDSGIGRQIPPGLDTKLVELSNAGDGALAADLGQAADDSRHWTHVATVLALLALILSVLLAPDRRRGVARAGFAVAGAGAVVVMAYYVGRAYVGARASDPLAADAVRDVWSAFLLDLRDRNLFLVVIGLAIAGATRGVLPELRARAALEGVARALTTVPSNPAARALRAAALVGIGVVTLLDHEAVLSLLAFALGAGLVYAGVAELMRLTLPAEVASEASDDEPPRPGRRVSGRVALAGAAVVALLAIAGFGLAGANDAEDPPFEIKACNGSAALCDRTISQVTFPSTHNSMSAATEPSWLFANQNDGVTAQLEAGVRGLLIDTHYGVATSRGVYTILERDPKSREKLEGALGPEGIEVAERLRRRIGYKGGGKPEVFWCHAFCELGATAGPKLLGEIRDFLARHPYEVLMVSIEDGVTPEDTADLFKRTGLLGYVYRGRLEPEPTLRDLIESGERVIVMGEENVGDVSWFRQQFDLVSETPYEFGSPAQLQAPSSCGRSRGALTNPLLLINHWVDTSPAPRVSNARRVNARKALLGRARRCARERHRAPNIVAVDLYREGDLFAVTQELNRAR